MQPPKLQMSKVSESYRIDKGRFAASLAVQVASQAAKLHLWGIRQTDIIIDNITNNAVIWHDSVTIFRGKML